MAYKSDVLKKTLTWSSAKSRDYLNALLKDLAATESRSESSMIEDALYSHFVSNNRNARFIAEGLYTRGLAQCYEDIFHVYEAGSRWDAAYDNGRAIVEAMREAIMFRGAEVDATHCLDELAYFHNNLKLVAEYLDQFDPSAAEYLRALITMQNADPKHCNFINIVTLILETWEWIGNKSLMYRSLAAACRIAPTMIADDAQSRCRYLSVLKAVSTVWR